MRLYVTGVDLTVMQPYNLVYKRKTDSCARITVQPSIIGLGEPFENLLEFILWYSIASILELDVTFFRIIRQVCAHMNLASWWRIFKRIRQDISDNNLHSFLVGPHFYRTVGEFEIEHYVAFLAYHAKLILKTANKIVEIKLADMKAHLPVLNLSEIENLINERKHLIGILLHQAHVFHALCR